MENTATTPKTKSLGEERVRTEFNPANNGLVDQIKQKSAELINLINGLETTDKRSIAIALTEIETGCMYGVKAATASK